MLIGVGLFSFAADWFVSTAARASFEVKLYFGSMTMVFLVLAIQGIGIFGIFFALALMAGFCIIVRMALH